MDVGTTQQLVVDSWFRPFGDAVTAEHEYLADVVLSSPLPHFTDLVGLDVDEVVQLLAVHPSVLLDEFLLKVQPLIVQLRVLASPDGGTLPLIGSGVLHQRHVLRNTQQQFLEITVSFAFLPHAEEHPLEAKRGKVLPHLVAETSLSETFGGISTGIIEQCLLDLPMSVGVVGELATEVQPFAVLPCRAVELEGKAPAMLVRRRLRPLTMSSTFLKDQTFGVAV